MSKHTPAPEEVANPRMKAFLHSGGLLENSHGSYTNCYFMIWMSERWREWETLNKDNPEWKRRPHRTLHHNSFDLWLQSNYGKPEWAPQEAS